MAGSSKLIPISYFSPKQSIRLNAYADTIIYEPDGRRQILRAIRFGGYPEMVRALADALYAGADLEATIMAKTSATDLYTSHLIYCRFSRLSERWPYFYGVSRLDDVIISRFPCTVIQQDFKFYTASDWPFHHELPCVCVYIFTLLAELPV